MLNIEYQELLDKHKLLSLNVQIKSNSFNRTNVKKGVVRKHFHIRHIYI
jgi:hypothetical protein